VKEKLRWEPEVNPKEGVNKLVEWVKENRNLLG
jgi:nucleoside-diphosphate-sugar epimerase